MSTTAGHCTRTSNPSKKWFGQLFSQTGREENTQQTARPTSQTITKTTTVSLSQEEQCPYFKSTSIKPNTESTGYIAHFDISQERQEECFRGALEDNGITVKMQQQRRILRPRRRIPETAPRTAWRQQFEVRYVHRNTRENSMWTRILKMTCCGGVHVGSRRVGSLVICACLCFFPMRFPCRRKRFWFSHGRLPN